MAYNLSLAGNATGVLDLVQAVNSELMLGWLGVLILLTVTGITFMAFMFSTQDMGKALASTSYLAIGFSLFLRAIDLIPNIAFFISVIVCALSLAFLYKRT